ncbi:MAG: VOC family protein [Maritimibacter sp.]|nr:VOC family protein [Maritimibacter sp.]
MFSHITLGIADPDRALAFYRPLTEALGLIEKFAAREDGRFWAGYVRPDAPRPLFILTQPWDGAAAAPGNGTMVAFQLETRAEVDRLHALALALGGADEGPPGLRTQYHADYYGGYLRDPDGNKLCLVCHAPPPTGSTSR